MSIKQRAFYERQYVGSHYAQGIQDRTEAASLHAFVESYGLKDKRVLEVGCGRGAFQDIVADWHGVDITDAVSPYIRKSFAVASAESLPYQGQSFDGLWSIAVLEHVPNPEQALREIVRILKPGGVAYLAPAWHCRPWTAQAYHLRSWGELDWKGRLVKITIPLRESLWFRASFALPLRLWRELLFLLRFKKPIRFYYHKLQANYAIYWTSDSDACCSLDPHEMLLWFRSRGWETPSHPSWLSRFLVRHGPIVVRKPIVRSFRLAILASHPIQYHVPLFRALALRKEIDLTVYFLSDWGAKEYYDPGFGKRIKWDIPLLEGYRWCFVRNYSPTPAADRFWGTFNPGIILELFRNKHDAIIIPGYSLFSYWLGYAGAWLSGTPVFFRGETVLRPDRPWWIRIPKHILLTNFFRTTTSFLSINKRSYEFYKFFGISDERIFFSPYGVDNDFFMNESGRWRDEKKSLKSAMGMDEHVPVIIFVGKLIDRKRPFDLLYAYECLDRRAALMYVGDGEMRQPLERYVRERGLSRVFFCGFKNQTELPKYYALADIFVLPSSAEVSPLVINEAMCCGLPIIASDAIPSVIDFVRSGENGYAYPCGDIDKLGEALCILVVDGDLRHSMGRRSEEIIKSWSIPAGVDGILCALRRLAERKGLDPA